MRRAQATLNRVLGVAPIGWILAAALALYVVLLVIGFSRATQ